MRDWQPIETAQKIIGRRIIGFDDGDGDSVHEIVWSDTGDKNGKHGPCWVERNGFWFGATHWMPLPKPPA